MSAKEKSAGGRILSVILRVLIAILLLLAILIGAAYVAGRIVNGEFYSLKGTYGNMPGLEDGFIPQGIDYNEDGSIFISGYMDDDSASRIYRIAPDGTAYKITLLKESGKPFTGHCGGIAHYGDYLYVGGSGGLYVFSLTDFTVNEDSVASQVGFFDAGMTASFVYTHDGYVYFGTYADGGKFNSKNWQSHTTPTGEKNPSLMAKFKLDASEVATFGIAPTPVAAYSIRDRVQGAAICDEGIILSTSSGANLSTFSFYSPSEDSMGEVEFGGEGVVTIPLYYLDSSTLTHTITSMPMSEEIEIVDGKLYIVYESATNKYLFGRLLGAEKLIYIELSDSFFK